jgi:hypothetical protein
VAPTIDEVKDHPLFFEGNESSLNGEKTILPERKEKTKEQKKN